MANKATVVSSITKTYSISPIKFIISKHSNTQL